ncbi:hypothetical protein HAX54_049782 [Datura stramonium]|uniref:Small EDRK-rich factor-like N-terminal domain-containing protein n=1 Tax=Datura stramonium TaxID=4076 RepID=A0ABS8SW28_DATST|nr:hypothetical protein [Datura stramonium]
MTRGKQKIEAQRKNAERNQKGKGSQLEARAVGLKVICPICKVKFSFFFSTPFSFSFHYFSILCVSLSVDVAVTCGNLVIIGRVSFMDSNLDLSLLLYSLVGDAVENESAKSSNISFGYQENR